MKQSPWSRYTELMEKGLETLDITDDEKVVLAELQETLTALAKGAKPMLDLESSAQKTANPFFLELAKFNNRMAFISARTSDEVCKLTELIRCNNETVEKQFQLAKAEEQASQCINKRADLKASCAIWVAIFALVISSLIGITSICIAHHDSSATSRDIIKAIRQYKVGECNNMNH